MSEFVESTVYNSETAALLNRLANVEDLLKKLSAKESDLESMTLLEQLKDLVHITGSIHEFSTNIRRYPSTALSTTDRMHLGPVLKGIAEMSEECTMSTEVLESALKSIDEERTRRGYATPESWLRNQPWYNDTYQALQIHTAVLRLLHSAINLLFRKQDADSDGTLSAEARTAASTFHYYSTLVNSLLGKSRGQITQRLRRAVDAAQAISLHVQASMNRHFFVRTITKSFYTGRDQEMAQIRDAFTDTAKSSQKRFVIYGLSGSGKTELAIKYAELYQHTIWGVFFVDGSCQANASGSYSEIATIGGVEPNERSAKNWLRTRDLPWLLIVDNVDDDEVNLDDLLPSGTKGSIIITSRNPAHKTYGNVGKRFLELRPMEEDEASELILKAAEEPQPWAASVIGRATSICHALGFLPLALVHAAKAILNANCTWHNYLINYDQEIERIRRKRSHRRARSPSRTNRQTDKDSEGDSDTIFSTYEILYRFLESSQEEQFQDAVELLHIFSFFHFQNIRLDTFINVIINPIKENQQQEKLAEEDDTMQKKTSYRKKKSWLMWLRELRIGLSRYMETPTPLPLILRNLGDLTQREFEYDVNIRLRNAMNVLARRSLVVKLDRDGDRYGMHPLVHKWIRERPEVSVSEQALWCQIAMTTMAKSIMRPPMDDNEKARQTRRELLPHIVHVRTCEASIKKKLEEHKSRRISIWPTIEPKYGWLQADTSVRISRVYSEYGLFREALQLQRKLHSFLIERLGEDHQISIQVTLLVSGTLWELTETAESTLLQRRARQFCLDSLGEHHTLTLQVTELLGSTLMLRGRYLEAHGLLENNLREVRNLYGNHHERTFLAMRSLGRIKGRNMHYEEATQLHQEAWEGMKSCRGEAHLETLTCHEDLAMSYLHHDRIPYDREGEYLQASHESMKFVYEKRKELLGKEQPYTLLAHFHLAQVKAALGQLKEAERMMRHTISIAEINVGEEHIMVLAAKANHGRLLAQLGRYEEGILIIRAMIRKPQYRRNADEDGDHPDRIGAMWFLVDCLERQNEFVEALDTCEEMLLAMHVIGGKGRGLHHNFISVLTDKISTLKGKVTKDII